MNYRIGTWHGKSQYACLLCRFETLGLERMLDHQRRQHPGAEVPDSQPIDSAQGEPPFDPSTLRQAQGKPPFDFAQGKEAAEKPLPAPGLFRRGRKKPGSE